MACFKIASLPRSRVVSSSSMCFITAFLARAAFLSNQKKDRKRSIEDRRGTVLTEPVISARLCSTVLLTLPEDYFY